MVERCRNQHADFENMVMSDEVYWHVMRGDQRIPYPLSDPQVHGPDDSCLPGAGGRGSRPMEPKQAM